MLFAALQEAYPDAEVTEEARDGSTVTTLRCPRGVFVFNSRFRFPESSTERNPMSEVKSTPVNVASRTSLVPQPDPAPRKRPSKPGMVRVVVSLTQEHHDALEAAAKADSPVFPRPVNEHLSILIDKRFNALMNGTILDNQ